MKIAYHLQSMSLFQFSRYFFLLLFVSLFIKCSNSKDPRMTYLEELQVPNSCKLYIIIPHNACSSCVEKTINELNKLDERKDVCYVVPTNDIKLAKIYFSEHMPGRSITYDSKDLAYKLSVSKDFPTYFMLDSKSNQITASGQINGASIETDLLKFRILLQSLNDK